jgi:hypothetical protein
LAAYHIDVSASSAYTAEITLKLLVAARLSASSSLLPADRLGQGCSIDAVRADGAADLIN